MSMKPKGVFKTIMRCGAMVSVGSTVLCAMGLEQNEANVSRHLGVVGRVNLGSFYTPAKYVRQVSTWLLKHNVGKGWTIADLSCGYGAFFELQDVEGLHGCRYIGNDIDHQAISKARQLFPHVELSELNALIDVSRHRFGLAEHERVVIVGNPPYNDVTSQINQKVKSKLLPIDADIKSRDIGMSSLLAYNKLRADYVAVLHPLSYLIKKANFSAARTFFNNYKLLESVVFSSQEFAGTSKTAGFPVVVALYRRAEGAGLTYEAVGKTAFHTVEGESFSLAGFDYVTDFVDKYPSDKRYDPEMLFYTMRDINALRRSRTFIRGRIANAVDIDPAKLAYYCYIDCFKRYAVIPYYMGNFNVPFVQETFGTVSNEVCNIAKHYHQDIFGPSAAPEERDVAKVKSYIAESIKGRSHAN